MIFRRSLYSNANRPIALWRAEVRALPSFLALSRAGTGTFVDSDGVIRTAAANAPRFDFTGGRAGLLIEASEINYLVRSEQFDISAWVKDTSGGVAPVVTPDFALAPDGSMNADRVELVRGSAFSRIAQSVSTPSNTYTFSVYMRTVGAGPANVGFRMSAAAGSNRVITNAWSKFQITTSGAENTPHAQILLWTSIPATDPTADILMWGAKLVPGTSDFRSYIPTTASGVTRPADTLSAAALGANPAIIQQRDLATGVRSRVVVNPFANISAIVDQQIEAIAVYPRGISTDYLNQRLSVDGAW
jgi:hypothetical protein